MVTDNTHVSEMSVAFSRMAYAKSACRSCIVEEERRFWCSCEWAARVRNIIILLHLRGWGPQGRAGQPFMGKRHDPPSLIRYVHDDNFYVSLPRTVPHLAMHSERR